MTRSWKVLLRPTFAFVLLAGLVPPLPAQAPPGDAETWNDYKLRLLREVASQKAGEIATERTSVAVEAKPTSATPPEGVAGRVNDTFADFLPFFQFAVDSVSTSDDQTAVTVKFNPLKLNFGAFSGSATVTEPQVFSKLDEGIVESARASQREALLKSVGDYSDVTAAVSFGYRRKGGNWSTTGKLFGREANLYKSLIEDLLKAAFEVVPQSLDDMRNKADLALAPLIFELQKKLPTGQQPGDTNFGSIRNLIQAGTLDNDFETRLLPVLRASVEAQAAFNAAIGRLELDALPVLIDNQPQIVLNASRRFSNDVVGPDTMTYSFSYEMGSKNFNAMLSRYRNRLRERSDTAGTLTSMEQSQLKLDSLSDVVKEKGFGKEQRFVFSAIYKDVSEYSFRHDYNLVATDGAEVPQMVDLRLPGSREWRAKFLWTRLMPKVVPSSTSPAFGSGALKKTVSGEVAEEQPPRFSFSVEGVWPGGRNAAKDQIIGRLSYLLPVARGVTIPVTVTYANRDELLGEQDHVFSGHLGISYKLGKGSTKQSTQ